MRHGCLLPDGARAAAAAARTGRRRPHSLSIPTEPPPQRPGIIGLTRRPTRAEWRRAVIAFALGIVAIVIVALFIHPHGLLLSAGQPAPSVTLHDVNGRRAQLGGATSATTVIEFASAGCGPCATGERTLCAVPQTPAWRFAIVDAAHDSAPAFGVYADAACGPQLLLDPQLDASRAYGVTAVPAYLVVDSSGRITFSGAGADGLQGAVTALRHRTGG